MIAYAILMCTDISELVGHGRIILEHTKPLDGGLQIQVGACGRLVHCSAEIVLTFLPVILNPVIEVLT